ncbi:hypothetical protein [Haladaptatus sp. NG-WS-4]
MKNCDIGASDANGAAIKSMNVGHLRFEGTTVKTGGSEVAHGLLIQQKTKSARIVGSTFVHETPGGFSLWMESGEEPVYVKNCEFKGNGGHDGARAAIRCDRDDCQLRNVTATQMGASRRRALVNTGTDVLIYEGEYRSPEYPIIDHGDSIWVESIYARSDGDFAGLRLSTSSSNAYVKKSHIVNGIRDDSGDLSGWGNDFSA